MGWPFFVSVLGVVALLLGAELQAERKQRRGVEALIFIEILKAEAADNTLIVALDLLKEWRGLGAMTADMDLLARTDLLLGEGRPRVFEILHGLAPAAPHVWGPGHPADDPATSA